MTLQSSTATPGDRCVSSCFVSGGRGLAGGAEGPHNARATLSDAGQPEAATCWPNCRPSRSWASKRCPWKWKSIDEVEFVLENSTGEARSDSSGRPCRFGYTPAKEYIIVIYEQIDDMIYPIAA